MAVMMTQRIEDSSKANIEGQAQITNQLFDIEARIENGFRDLLLENA
jgi:hypothetical protein